MIPFYVMLAGIAIARTVGALAWAPLDSWRVATRVGLAVMFIFARQVQAAPEVPTAFGMFIMTLPFLLWIVFAYWDKVVELFDSPEKPDVESAA